MSEQKSQEEYIRRIHKVQDYIEHHIGQPLSIEELGSVAGFSKYHFSRIFQGMLHESLAHYVNRIRMENALFLLAHRKDKNMTDIAYELGYTDSAVFSRAFKNYYGTSPREYRKEYSKNCKDSFLLSEYNKNTAKKEWAGNPFPVTGKITITNLEEKQVAYVRHTGTYETLAKEYFNLIQTLFAYAKNQHLIVDGENWWLAMYHDNPEFGEESQFRTSLCLTVPKDIGILAGLDNEDRFDMIEGIGPTVAVHQNTIRQSNPRSTVGTKTRILNQLALVYASDGKALEESDHLSPGSFLYTTVDGMCLSCQGRGSYYNINLEQLIPDKTTSLLEVYESLQVTAGFMRILKKKYGMYFETPFWELPEDIQGQVVYGTYENGKQSYCLKRILRNAYEKGEDVEEVYAKTICPDCHGQKIGQEAREVILHRKQIGEMASLSGDEGGEIIAKGTPQQLRDNPNSKTVRYLA